MWKLLPLLACSSFFSLQVLSESQVPDRFTREVLELIDDNISPCDNFYRHKCPRSLPHDKVPGTWALHLPKEILRKELIGNQKNTIINDALDFHGSLDGKELLSQISDRCASSASCLKEIYDVLRISNNLDERLLKEASESSDQNEESHVSQEAISTFISLEKEETAQGDENHLRYDSLHFYQILVDRQAIMDNLVEGLGEVDEIKEVFENVLYEIEKTFKSTPYLLTMTGWQEAYLKELTTTRMHASMSTFDRDPVELRKMLRHYEAAYYRAGDLLPGNSLWHLRIRHSYAQSVLEKLYDKSFIQYLSGFGMQNAFNGMNTREFCTENCVNSSLHLSLPYSVVTPHAYAALGDLIGHEFFHAFSDLRKYRGIPILPFLESPVYANAERCLLKHNSRFANETDEICPYSDKHAAEDVPDLEGIRAAFAALQSVVGNVSEAAYPGAKLSHAQLFFYSYFMVFCESQTMEPQEEPEEKMHSATVLRVNAVLRQLAEFQEAFGCKTGDFMVLPEEERCYFYGPKSTRHDPSLKN